MNHDVTRTGTPATSTEAAAAAPDVNTTPGPPSTAQLPTGPLIPWPIVEHRTRRGRWGWSATITLQRTTLRRPLRWTRPRTIEVSPDQEVCSDAMPRAALAALLEVIAATPQHSYLLTTRQPARLAQLLAGSPDPARGTNWPLTNLRLGIHVHAADQATLTDPTLQPSTGLWLDARRLHAPVDITGLLTSERIAFVLTDPLPAQPTWIHQAWAKDVVDQCQRAGVSCLPATGPTPARRTRPSLIRQCRPDAAADLHQTPALIPAATH